MRKPLLNMAEIKQALDQDDRFPLILTPSQLAELLGLSVKTIYEWIAKGRLDGTFRKRGRHNLIWRDRALYVIFNGQEWR